MLGIDLSQISVDDRKNVNQVPFADDTVLVADLEERLKQLIEDLGRCV